MPNDHHDIRAGGNPYASERADVAAYAAARPQFPQQAIDFALDGLAPGAVAVEVGAGTGIATRQLAERGLTVYALEPSAQMVRVLRQNLRSQARVTVLDQPGEHILLPESCADVVIYADSWHWIRQPEGRNQAQRIVKPHGRAVVLSNQLDVRQPWVHRLSRIMRSGDVVATQPQPDLGTAFTSPERHVVEWSDAVAPSDIFALARTRASWIRADDAYRERMQQNLAWYLYEHLGLTDHSTVRMPYCTFVWKATARSTH
ncbi:MAG: class I SAM-dependent methyltransferase [Actinomycetaceae bacterium]|nr:class I SAM-dependent methyltransferase [Actinomycetaceae bacterium]MDY6083285.1 class I SAM-dependent methyltransferase [Actinomycetaceae bacterium]